MGNADAADRVKDLADELERTLGVDEKLIMQVQTTLGTFGELAASADQAGERSTVRPWQLSTSPLLASAQLRATPYSSGRLSTIP